MAHQQAKEPIRGASLVGVIADFDGLLHRLAKIAGHLGRIGDRIEGARPEINGQVATDTPQHSTISELQRKRDNLLVLCDRLEREAGRIDSALGGDEPQVQMATGMVASKAGGRLSAY